MKGWRCCCAPCAVTGRTPRTRPLQRAAARSCHRQEEVSDGDRATRSRAMELGEGARGPWRWDDVHTWAVFIFFLSFLSCEEFLFFTYERWGYRRRLNHRRGRTITTSYIKADACPFKLLTANS